MDFSNLKPIKGAAKNADSKLGLSGKGGAGVGNVSNYDIKYLGNGNFRLSSRFVDKAKLETENGFILLSDPNATLATIKELALQIVPKSSEPRYFGKPRTGKNPKTGAEVAETKNSTLITSRTIEAYLVNCGMAQKDVKTAFTLSQTESNGNTYFTFVSNTNETSATNADKQLALDLGEKYNTTEVEKAPISPVAVDDEL